MLDDKEYDQRDALNSSNVNRHWWFASCLVYDLCVLCLSIVGLCIAFYYRAPIHLPILLCVSITAELVVLKLNHVYLFRMITGKKWIPYILPALDWIALCSFAAGMGGLIGSLFRIFYGARLWNI